MENEEATPFTSYELKVSVQRVGLVQGGVKLINDEFKVSVTLDADYLRYERSRMVRDGELGKVVGEIVEEAVHAAATHPDRPGGENGR